MVERSDQLVHYGIKGMRWGIRRTEAQLARARGELPSQQKAVNKSGGFFSKKKKTTAKKEEPKKTQKKISEMSDEELRVKINRLQLEKQYRDLSPKQVSKGRAFYEKNIAPALNETVKNIAKDYTNKKLREVLGLKNENYLDALQKEVKKLSLEAQREKLLEEKKKK